MQAGSYNVKCVPSSAQRLWNADWNTLRMMFWLSIKPSWPMLLFIPFHQTMLQELGNKKICVCACAQAAHINYAIQIILLLSFSTKQTRTWCYCSKALILFSLSSTNSPTQKIWCTFEWNNTTSRWIFFFFPRSVTPVTPWWHLFERRCHRWNAVICGIFLH